MCESEQAGTAEAKSRVRSGFVEVKKIMPVKRRVFSRGDKMAERKERIGYPTRKSFDKMLKNIGYDPKEYPTPKGKRPAVVKFGGAAPYLTFRKK